MKNINFIVLERCSTNDPDTEDVYVDVSNGDPVHYESIQLKVGETMQAMCHKVAAVSDSVDKLVENPMYVYSEAYSKGKYEIEELDDDTIDNIYETIPAEDYQDNN